MIYIICALSAEARLFLDHYKLKQYTLLPFKVYENQNIKLIISGVGSHNALLATTALLAHFTPAKDSILLNIGVAAAPSDYNINTLVVIHKLIYNKKSFYPDLLYSHPFEEATLTTVDEATSTLYTTLVDMEASAVFQAASRFLKSHQIAIVKIVSDHFSPESVTKELILDAFMHNQNEIFDLIGKIKSVQIAPSLFDAAELSAIAQHKTIFTKSQFQQFQDACYFFKLKREKKLILEIPERLLHKKERGEYLQNVITQLTH